MSSPPTENEALSLVHQGWNHLQLQRPLAAWASWQRALRVEPDQAAARQALDLLESAKDLPAAARAVYRFRNPNGDDRRADWNARMQGRDLSDLALAADVFRELAGDDPADGSAWYNHALCLAWKGANAPAIAALDRVVALEAETKPDLSADAWALAEVLRQGAGAESMADDLNHSLVVAWETSDGEPIASASTLALEPPIDPELGRTQFKDVKAFEWLDRPMPPAVPTPSLSDLPRILASAIQTPRSLRLSSPDPLASRCPGRAARANPGSDDPDAIRREAVPLPLRCSTRPSGRSGCPRALSETQRRAHPRARRIVLYEDRWIHLARNGLDGLSPLEAAAGRLRPTRSLRARLTAVVRVREQLGARPPDSRLYRAIPSTASAAAWVWNWSSRRGGRPGGPHLHQRRRARSARPAALDDLRLADAFESAAGLRGRRPHGALRRPARPPTGAPELDSARSCRSVRPPRPPGHGGRPARSGARLARPRAVARAGPQPTASGRSRSGAPRSRPAAASPMPP